MSERNADTAHVHDELLVADPDELRGLGDSAVARHVAMCAECASTARLILAEQQRLHDALLTLARQSHPRAHRHRRYGRVAAVAAAAAAALLVWLPRDPGGALEELPGPVVEISDVPKVNAAGRGAVAVMQTRDPRITVVWYLQQER